MFWWVSLVFLGPITFPLAIAENLGYGFDYSGVSVFLVAAIIYSGYPFLSLLILDIFFDDDYNTVEKLFLYAGIQIVIIVAIIFLWQNGLPF